MLIQKNEQEKVNLEISKEIGVSIVEVNKAIDLYFSGIAAVIREDKPSHIIVPFLGKLNPHKAYLKEYEANNS